MAWSLRQSRGGSLGRDFTVVAFDWSNYTPGYKGGDKSIEAIADIFGEFVKAGLLVPAPLYFEHVDVLAHSTGGLVVRSYIANLAPVQRYGGEFERLVLAGTPSYGLALGSLLRQFSVSVIRTQETEMAFSSPFVWKLHAAWHFPANPISPNAVLAIAGRHEEPRCVPGDDDGIVNLWSAALPVEDMASVGYAAGYSHSPVLPCTLPNALVYVANGDQTHATYLAAKEFFQSGKVIDAVKGPPARTPGDPVGDGLVLGRVVDSGGNPLPLLLVGSCPTGADCQCVWGSGGNCEVQLKALSGATFNCTDANCTFNQASGILSMRDVPSANGVFPAWGYCMTVARFGQQYRLAVAVLFNVLPDRPMAMQVPLDKKAPKKQPCP